MPYTCWRDAIEYQDLIFLNFNRLSLKFFQKINILFKNMGEIIKLKTCPNRL